MKRKTNEVAKSLSRTEKDMPLPKGFALLNTIKQAQADMNQ